MNATTQPKSAAPAPADGLVAQLESFAPKIRVWYANSSDPDVQDDDCLTASVLLRRAAAALAARDAARYRWLRETGTRFCQPLYVRGEESNGPVDDEVQCEIHFRLPPRPAFYANPNAAIDAAIAEQSKESM